MFILAFIICTVVIFIVSTKINRKRYDELNFDVKSNIGR